ncbi:MAG: hypothetical protein GY953_42295, partial [bacterium]|nr:hypothetical protein [bacterium]
MSSETTPTGGITKNALASGPVQRAGPRWTHAANIHLPLKFLLENRYQHVNFNMEERWPLDAVEHIPELFRVGEQRAKENFDTVNQQFFQHKR